MKLISSQLALEVILALTQQREGARLAEISEATGAPLSSVQRAMRLLLDDSLVERSGDRRPRYRLRSADRAGKALVDLAFATLAQGRIVRILACSNRAIEAALADREGYVAVTSATADPRDVLAFERALAVLAAGGEPIRAVRLEHHDAVRAVRLDPALGARVGSATVLKGSLARSFPTPHRPGSRARPARRRPLARLFPRMSQRALGAIAREHGVRRMRLFGSAARGDIGTGSDVDVLVEPSASPGLSIVSLVRLESDLEALFERHVDVVTPGALRDDVRRAAEREGVTILGRA